jgi:hypothetical protein
MAKKKKRNRPDNSPRKVVQFIKKTLFGEKLESAIVKPILEQPPAEVAAKKVESVRPVVTDRPVDNSPARTAISAILFEAEKKEPPKREISFPPKQSLDPASIARFRERIKTLFGDSQKSTSPLIKLGIDLGTSASKVAWRSDSKDSKVHLVSFRTDHLDLNSYFVPSVVAFDVDNLFSGFEGVSRSADSRVFNFKMCLACTSQESGGCGLQSCSLSSWPLDKFSSELTDREVQFVTSYFLARLIADAKSVIKNELSKTVPGDVNPKWTANLAVPETFIEQSPIVDVFREVFRTAWFMSEVFSDDSSLVKRQTIFECFVAARSLANESIELLDDVSFGCSIYPEVGAEVASIVMSRTTALGLYAFVDIGAGTIDASFFHYFREPEGKPNRPPYAASVSNELGAAQIEIQASRIAVDGNKFGIETLKEIKETYHNLTEWEKKLLKPQLNAIGSVLANLKPKTQEFLQTVFREARDNKDADIVSQPIRLVVGGGGSHLESFRSASIDAFTIKDAKKPKPPEVIELTVPHDLNFPLPTIQFHRFSVAYGLTFPIDKLPKMIFPKDVKKKQKPKRNDKDPGSWYEK